MTEKMDENSQAVLKDGTCVNAVEHRVLDILNPMLHHHDLLQSYVMAPTVFNSDSKQNYEEFKESGKETYLGKSKNINDNKKNNHIDVRNIHEKRKNSNGEREKEKFDMTAIESEMRMQKSRRR